MTRRTTRMAREATRNRRAHNALVVKLTVAVGMALVMLLPHDYKEWALLALNNLWLWKGG